MLVSVANISSSTAVEQLLGRILRQPDAKKRNDEALNQSYAFITSRDFYSTAQALVDQLVNVGGFERKDASQYIAKSRDSWLELFGNDCEITLPAEFDPKPFPEEVRSKLGRDQPRRKLKVLRADLVENFSNFQPYALAFREKSKFFRSLLRGRPRMGAWAV